MKKLLFASAVMAAISCPAMAGGLLTNTNQNAVFLRNPARDAAIAIDGVYSNPAGVAFLPTGYHFSVSWQAALQKREMTSYAPFYQLNTQDPNQKHKFRGKSIAPVIPSIQFAYVFNDKWSISTQFAIGGGGGSCEFGSGLPMFEQLLGGVLASTIAGTSVPMPINETGMNQSGLPYTYSMNQFINGKQYFYTIQEGATYKINKHLSVFGGVRFTLANCGYDGAITDFYVNGRPGNTYSVAFNEVSQTAAAAAKEYAAAGDMENAQMFAAMAKQAGTVALMTQSDLVLDCQQRGNGIAPILGVDLNLGRLNLAAKYEFRTKINLKNKSHNSANINQAFDVYADGNKVRSDIPALLTVGAQYSILNNVRAMAGFHYYFDKDAKGSATNVEKNTWETTYGIEWDPTKWLTVSAGSQRTKYNFGDRLQDTNFNISSNALCLGASFRLSESVNVNLGYMHSFYGNETIDRGSGVKDHYTRKNDVVGVSLDLNF